MRSTARRSTTWTSIARALAVLLSAASLGAVTLASYAGAPKDPAALVLAAAEQHLGDTYTWAATGPRTWDCSGFTSTMWHDAGGVKVPRTSRQQQAWAVPVPVEQVLPGDLVFFGDPVTHVGLVEKRTGTTVLMIDASSSQKGVVERPVWRTGTVRYGRVPRPGMPAVRPWQPVPPAATGTVTPPKPVTSPAPAAPLAPAAGKKALAGLPRTQAGPSSKVMLAAARLATAALGEKQTSDVGLVRDVWRRAGGAALPAGRSRVVAAGHRVPLADARVGDLVVYPGSYLAVYVGMRDGQPQMVGASRALGAVVQRVVWDAPAVQVVRLDR